MLRRQLSGHAPSLDAAPDIAEQISESPRKRGYRSRCYFFFQAEDGIRDYKVTGVQTCALPILSARSTGAAPRQRGSSDGCTLSQSARSSRTSGISAP